MDGHIGFQVKMLSKLIKKRVDGTIGDGGVLLTGMQRWLVHYLFVHPDEELFQKDIEKKFGMGRSSATELLQSLEEAGMITRTPLERDARLKKISLTDAAIAQQKRVERVLLDVEKRLVKDFTPQESKELRVLLERCIRNMSEDGAEVHQINTDTKI